MEMPYSTTVMDTVQMGNFKKILKKCQIIANPLALPESVIEIQGEVRDD